MNIAQIEEKVAVLTTSFDKQKFIYDFLLAYGLPKASITRIKKGNLNLSKNENEISWKKKVYFREELTEDLHVTLSNIESSLSHKQRFVIVTDYKTWLAADTKTGDKLDVPFKDLAQYYDFFLPWAGMEKTQHQNENPADVKAAEKMAKLFDEIKKDNPQDDPAFISDLNVFLSRLLFCFFAEDTNIFEENQFTNALASHTQKDGSDLNAFLDSIFEVLNTHNKKRSKLPAYIDAFPYVNGGLFEQSIQAPTFTRKSRQAIIAAGELDWKDINPDIFGSMFQAVIGVEQRGSLGQHYTSVPNIMKVIEPLFLNDLKEQFQKAGSNSKKLNALLNRMASLKIFDPACGSGNFLIIAYKELRRLEIQIIKKLNIGIPFSSIALTQFYGIEIDAFAVEIAQLSLWLAEHQMNVEFFQAFGKTNPTLPLKQAGHIVCGNACRVDWEEVCPRAKEDEIYILGNPPFIGGKDQSKEQKADMKLAFQNSSKIGELDYVSTWFYKASKYSNEKVTSAFVTTASIIQGSQVPQLWPKLFSSDIEIKFAYKPFKWRNNAKQNAAVIVSIIGFGVNSKKSFQKTIFFKNEARTVSNINAYLIDSKTEIIQQSLKQISGFNEMKTGNSPYDGGNLILSKEDVDKILSDSPGVAKLIRTMHGSHDFINGKKRYCIWVNDADLDLAKSNTYISDRIQATLESRKNGGDVARGLVKRPHQFRYTYVAKENLIIIPRHSSERRKYIPFGFLDASFIINDSAQVIYDPSPYVFSVLTSLMHMTWVRTTGGYIGTSIRYLSGMCYNTFPFPPISASRKEELTICTFRILEEREKHPEKTLAQLYDPDKMPNGLREAHRLNDLAVERCYRSKPFESDEERLEYLFKLYEKMIQEEKDKETLFQKEKKTRKKKSKK